MSDTPTVFHVRNRLCELILWLLVCLAPWAFGSVEAWAELGLYALIGLLTILVPGACDGSRFPRFLARLPGMALIGLTLLAGFQALPLSRVTLSWIAPTSAALRADLLPARSEQLRTRLAPPFLWRRRR